MSVRKMIKELIPPSFHPHLRRLRGAVGGDIRATQQARLRAICETQMRTNAYNYEPVNIAGRTYPAQRDWQIRWAAIKTELDRIGPGSLLDVGCAEGWFVRRAAEDCGFFAIGMETRMDRIMPGEVARLHDGAENYATIRALLSSSNIAALPEFDAISCFSVVHHIVYSAGIEKGREFVNALGLRCRKLFLFEMGTSDERRMEWATKMPEMPDGQEAFIRGFLSSAGFLDIRSIAVSSSFKQESDRMLFAAVPPPRHPAG